MKIKWSNVKVSITLGWRSPFYHHKRFYLMTWCGVSDEARVHCTRKLLSSRKNLLWIHFKGYILCHHHLFFDFKVRNNLTWWVSRSRLHGKVSNNITWYLIYSVHRPPREKTTFWKQLNTRYLLFCSVQQQVEELRLVYRRKNISNIFNTLERENCVEVWLLYLSSPGTRASYMFALLIYLFVKNILSWPFKKFSL